MLNLPKLLAVLVTGLSLTIAQAQSFQPPVVNSITVGGYPQRESPGVLLPITPFGPTYIAYTTSSVGNNQSSGINIASNIGTTNGLTFGNVHAATVNGVPITGNFNPALANFGGYIYMAVRSGTGVISLTRSSDSGNSWSTPIVLNVPPVEADPIILGDPTNNVLYLAGSNNNTHNLILCNIPGGDASLTSCPPVTDTHRMFYTPGLALYNNSLYMSFTDRGSDHCVYFFNYSYPQNSLTFHDYMHCAEQASAATSLIVFNNALYLGSRTNDASVQFRFHYSTDGSTFTGGSQPGGQSLRGAQHFTFIGGLLTNIFAANSGEALEVSVSQ